MFRISADDSIILLGIRFPVVQRIARKTFRTQRTTLTNTLREFMVLPGWVAVVCFSAIEQVGWELLSPTVES